MEPLSRELIDQVIFAMENQESLFLFDADKGRMLDEQACALLSEEAIATLFPVPSWKPADGFILMERFVTTLHSPLERERLRAILQQGKGVFRNFKNALRETKHLEQLWFKFKERELHRRVVSWFNEIRKVRGLEQIKWDFEDTDDLVISDFSVVLLDPQRARELIPHEEHLSFEDVRRNWGETMVSYLKDLRSFRMDRVVSENVSGMGVLLDEETVGYLLTEALQGGQVRELIRVYVEPEYRGLGIARLLLEQWAGLVRSQQPSATLVSPISTSIEFLAPSLQRLGFKVFQQVLAL